MKQKIFLCSLAAWLIAATSALAATGNMDASYYKAWSDSYGVVDMSNVVVNNSSLSGYALIGSERLDFSTASYQVKNDGLGNLSGSAYSSKYGMFKFDGVNISSEGYFMGNADGGISGHIAFNCRNNTYCTSIDQAKVRTNWRIGAADTTATASTQTTTATSGTGGTAVSYKACESINDYISYVKCIADVDAKNSAMSGQTTSSADALPGNAKDYSVIINNNSEYTNSNQVTVKLKAPAEATIIAVSKDSNFGFSPREAFAASKTFLLDETEDTPQYVYVKFFDKNSKALFVASDSIIYSKTKGDAKAEAWAAEEFIRLYGRQANTDNTEDAKALSILAYDLDKSAARDLKAEAAALKSYQKLYKANPSNANGWKAVKALAYAKVAAEADYKGNPDTATTSKSCKMSKVLTLSFGLDDKNAQVAILKQFLFCQGYLAKEDKTEIFNETTEKAVKAFQEKNNLKCKDGSYCGYVGPSTRKAFNDLSAKAAVVVKTTGATTNTTVKAKLTQNLTIGSNGTEVSALQTYLAEFPEYYPEGKVSGTFDEATEKAVSRFQEKNSLKCNDGTYCGYVGPSTRAKFNQLMK